MSPSDTNSFFSGPVGMCVSAKAVYGWFKNGDPSATDNASQTWEKVSGLQTDVGTLINKAVQDSGATWTGAAGDSMRSSTSPLSTWADVTSQSAKSGSAAISDVSSAFRTAQNSVQQPVEVPDKPWYNSVVPWDTDYDDAVEKSQGVDEANMRVINAYGDRTNTSMSSMPTFEAPPDSTAEIDDGGSESSKSRIEYPSESSNQPGKNGSDPGGDSSSSSTNQGRNDVFSPPTNDTTGNNDTTGTDNDDTTNPSDTGGTTRPSDVNDPNLPSTGGTPGRPSVGTPGGVGDPSGTGLVGPFGPNDPRNPANKVSGGTSGRGGAGGGLGGGAGGSRGGLGGGAGAGASAGAGAGRGGLSGPGAAAAAGQFGGAAGAAEGAGRGAGGFGAGGAAAGGRGAAGGAGAMGAGGHGAKGEGGDDLEHTSKYLQPSDEYFGDGTMVAPPVIGG